MAKLYGIGTSVYVKNGDGEILLLKRAGGAAKGSWYIPGGGLDEGETTEECARRELMEETGLVVDGPMQLVAVTPMFAYGHDMFLVAYAADYTGGDVKLSHEHEGFRWLCPRAYRDKYFSDESIKVAEQRSEGAASMSKSVQVELDTYLEWVS